MSPFHAKVIYTQSYVNTNTKSCYIVLGYISICVYKDIYVTRRKKSPGGGENRSFQYIWGYLYQKHNSMAWVRNQILHKTMEFNKIAMFLPPHIARWTRSICCGCFGFFLTDIVVTIKTSYLWELKNQYGPCFCSLNSLRPSDAYMRR